VQQAAPKNRQVVVFDHLGTRLEPTSSANARILLREGCATLRSKDPVAITLARTANGWRRSAMQVVSWTDFFKEERDVFLQNISSTVVSMEFRDHGGVVIPIRILPTRDPVNLTEHIPFELIKRSQDFRKLVNRQPSVVIILSEAEYRAYFEKKAQQDGADPEAVASQASKRATTFDTPSQAMLDPIPSGPAPMDANSRARTAREAARADVAQEFTAEEDEVHPRLLHITQQFQRDTGEDADAVMNRYSPNQCLADLQTLGALAEVDLNFILARIPYKSVRAWAQQQLVQITAATQIDDVEEAAKPTRRRRAKAVETAPPTTTP
jgi:hypothetical protein